MEVDPAALARGLHVIGVIVWIGGVAMVTTAVLPAARAVVEPGERMGLFERIERRFAPLAAGATLLVGATGFYMIVLWNLWDRFLSAAFWWMHAMVLVWALFSLMLFVLEPLFLHRWLVRRASEKPASTFRASGVLHSVLLVVALITVLGAVVGSHGGTF
jgi:uncharacterized membrane protein